MANTDHAMAWIREHVRTNQTHCKQVLSEFSRSWQFVMAHLAGKCRRQLFLDLFGEGYSTENSHCCDVCDTEVTMNDCNAELCTLINAVHTVGEKGELKVVQWIRGSLLAWTDQYDKNAISYGKSHHHSEKWWRTFIHQCHVLGLVQKQLRSVIKKSEHYSIQGILVVQDKGREVAADIGKVYYC